MNVARGINETSRMTLIRRIASNKPCTSESRSLVLSTFVASFAKPTRDLALRQSRESPSFKERGNSTAKMGNDRGMKRREKAEVEAESVGNSGRSCCKRERRETDADARRITFPRG